MNRFKRYFKLVRIWITEGGYPRGEYLRKIRYFGSQGEHCYIQPWNFGTEPENIFLGDNVHIASNVTFITHDVTNKIFNYIDKQHHYVERVGKIYIGNNVFLGTNSTILYDSHLGNNVIVGAGSVVCGNIPDGVVVAGVPGKIIGKFEDYQNKILKELWY